VQQKKQKKAQAESARSQLKTQQAQLKARKQKHDEEASDLDTLIALHEDDEGEEAVSKVTTMRQKRQGMRDESDSYRRQIHELEEEHHSKDREIQAMEREIHMLEKKLESMETSADRKLQQLHDETVRQKAVVREKDAENDRLRRELNLAEEEKEHASSCDRVHEALARQQLITEQLVTQLEKEERVVREVEAELEEDEREDEQEEELADELWKVKPHRLPDAAVRELRPERSAYRARQRAHEIEELF